MEDGDLVAVCGAQAALVSLSHHQHQYMHIHLDIHILTPYQVVDLWLMKVLHPSPADSSVPIPLTSLDHHDKASIDCGELFGCL